MADYHSPTVIETVIPFADMTSLERLLLEAVFEAEIDQDEDHIYFFSRLGSNDFIFLDRDQLLVAFEESVAVAGSTAAVIVAERLRSGNRDTEAEDCDLDIAMTETSWQTILQDIVKRSLTLTEIVVFRSFTCSKMRSDGFGGAVTLITDDTISHKSTFDMLDDLRTAAERMASLKATKKDEAIDVQLETQQFAIISTGHISRLTASMLDDTLPAKWPCVGGSYADYGWFFYAHDENCGVGEQRIPDDLFDVMTWARSQGFSHVLLDRDADVIDDLAWFDW